MRYLKRVWRLCGRDYRDCRDSYQSVALLCALITQLVSLCNTKWLHYDGRLLDQSVDIDALSLLVYVDYLILNIG